MDYLISNLLATMPTGMWEKIIVAFTGAIGNFVLAIILLTICIKVVMLPLEFFNRKMTSDMTAKQQKMQPMIDDIKRRYPDQQVQNQKISEVYKKNNLNPMGSCLVMIVYMVLTLVIFITLLNGLNAMVAYKVQYQYEQLNIAYVSEYVENEYSLDINKIISDNEAIEGEGKKTVYEIVSPYIAEIQTKDETVKNTASKAVEEKYKEVKESFLWIDNVWLPETPYTKSVLDFNSYANLARLVEDQKNDGQLKQDYEIVMKSLKDEAKPNGYFVLVIITAGISFLNQFLMSRANKKRQKEEQQRQLQYNKKATQQQPQTGKMSMIILPLIMTVFTLFYNSMFALYLITSQLMGIATSPLINWIIKKIQKKKQEKTPDNRMKRIGG